TRRSPSRAPLPGVATTSAHAKPRRAASSATRPTAPGANTTRCGVMSWTKEAIMRCVRSTPCCAAFEPTSALFAPDAERFLGRALGDREQPGVLGRGGGIGHPRPPHEHVLPAPFEDFVFAFGSALALGTDEDRAVGRAVVLALEAFRQQRQVPPHGGEPRPA